MRSMAFVVFALCLLAGSELISAEEESAQLPPNYKDAVILGAQIVWPSPDTKPVGFDKTHSAIVDMLTLMDSPMYKEQVESEPFMAGIKKSLERFQDVCEFNKAKCLSVFSAIDELKAENEENINVIPYLEGCEQRQTDFCQGGDKPNPIANFFGKIATICSPKDKNCNKQ